MKKVLILANSSSGLYGFRNELLLALLKEYQVHVSLPDDTNNEQLKEEGCHIYHTSLNRRGMNPIQDMGLLKSYIELIRKIRPDVVLTYTIKPNVYGGLACRILKVPYIANITGLGSALENGGILQKIALLLYKIGLKRASCVFLQNEFNMQFFKEHRITRAKKRRIPGSGVNVEKFLPMPMPQDVVGDKEQCSEFLYISRVMKEKGIEQYLATSKYIYEKYPNTKFHVLGYCEEDYLEILKNEEKNGNICYHGSVLDVRPYMEKCQCLIHPSFYPEGMSNVCLEAAASGRVVITTKRPGCFETVEDGKTGYLVSEQNTEELIEAVERFIHLPFEDKNKMGLAGREKMKTEFDRQIIVKAYLEEIRSVM